MLGSDSYVRLSRCQPRKGGGAPRHIKLGTLFQPWLPPGPLIPIDCPQKYLTLTSSQNRSQLICNQPAAVAAMSKFPRFQELPTEIRLEIWRLISLPSPIPGKMPVVSHNNTVYYSTEQKRSDRPVNIYPQCNGYCVSSRDENQAEQSREVGIHPTLQTQKWHRERQLALYKAFTKTPTPITTKINQESRAETLRYWVIELYPKRGLGPLCFLPGYHQLYVDWCCFSRPERFRKWLILLKARHPSRMETVTSFGIGGICWWGKHGFKQQMEKLNNEKSSLGSSENGTGANTQGPFDALLELPRLQELYLGFASLPIRHPHNLAIYKHNIAGPRQKKVAKGFKEFMESHKEKFVKGPPGIYSAANSVAV